MAKSTKQVQGTNDYSIVSKCSMVQAGYFNDEFIHHFVSKCSRRSPLINIGYYIRATIIDFTLHTFLTDVLPQPAQIVSCGAGFDTNYFRLKTGDKLHPAFVYYEVDFPEVVERKSRIIGDTVVLSQAVGVPDDESRQYRLLACDLQQLDNLESTLRLAGVNFSLPTLFLSECAVTYMDEPSSSALIRWVSDKFDRAVFAMYEQVHPEDGFGIVMAKHFESINTPLLSLATFPDLGSQEERYTTRGWSSCVSRSAWDVFINITDSAERRRAYNLEPFDEMEELHLKCCHYALTIASKGFITSLLNIPLTSPPRIRAEESKHIQWLVRETDANIDINRFSHTTTRLSEPNGYLVVGGFGHSSDKKHGRCKEVLLSNNGGVHVLDISFTSEEDKPEVSLDTMHHTCTNLSGTDSAVLYGGRTGPGRPVNVRPVVLTLETIGSDSPLESSDNVSLRAVAEVKTPVMGGGLPRSRYRHSAVCLVSAADGTPKNYVVVFGGRTKTFQALEDAWILDVCSEETCRRVEKRPGRDWPRARFSHGATPSDSHTRMFVTGGLCQHLTPFCDVWSFDLATEVWHELSVVMLPRYGHTASVVGGSLILLGGVNTLAGSQPGICIIDVATSACVEYALPAQDPERPIMLHNHSTLISSDNSTVQVIGGGGNCFSFGTAFNRSGLSLDLRGLLGAL